MAKRLTERQHLARQLDTLNDSEVKEVIDFISIMESMRRASSFVDRWEDEVVARLANEPENRRARQAFEWEMVRRRTVAGTRPRI